MLRCAFVCLLCSFAAVAQSPSQPVTSDAQAVSLAQQSITALTGGKPIGDATLNANVTSIVGTDYESGLATLRVKGTQESRVDLNLPNGSRSEARSFSNGFPAGAWSLDSSASTQMAQHNTWIDAGWFFPALSSLCQTGNPLFVFRYIGSEQHDGLAVQHIQSYQIAPSTLSNSAISSLSTMDFYLDPNSYLPLAIAFNLHADTNMGVNIPVEIRFAQYQAVGGVEVPLHIQRLLNGSLSLDVNVTSAVFNNGLQDSLFTLP